MTAEASARATPYQQLTPLQQLALHMLSRRPAVLGVRTIDDGKTRTISGTSARSLVRKKLAEHERDPGGGRWLRITDLGREELDRT